MGIFNRCTNLESIEFKVPIVCLVTGCVSGRRDACYITINSPIYKLSVILQKQIAPVTSIYPSNQNTHLYPT